MLNPDYIPPEIGWPVAFLLWLLLLVMILWDRRKLKKVLKFQDDKHNKHNKQHEEMWKDIGSSVPGQRTYTDYTKPPQPTDYTQPPQTRRQARIMKPVSNFYDQEQDNAE